MTKNERAYQRVEIARSFSFKLNVGNYESRDFFCSQKKECFEKDAEETSEQLYAFCKTQVMRAVSEHRAENQPMSAEEIRDRKASIESGLRKAQ